MIIIFKRLLSYLAGAPLPHTHAGGVVYRTVGEYLIVSGKRSTSKWVLPKGHLEKNETEEQTAVREVFEESGVRAKVIRKLGVTRHLSWNLVVKVISFYLMEFESESANSENRKVIWLNLSEARKKLSYSYQKKIMDKL